MEEQSIRYITRSLSIMLLVMIGSYFTISESVAITQGFKIASRMMLMAWVIFLYYQVRDMGLILSWTPRNSLAMWTYLLYLLLGFASFMWSSKVSYSVLQWFMTVQSLVFVFVFVRIIYLVRHFHPEVLNLNTLFAIPIVIILGIFVVGAFVSPEVFYRSMRGGEETRLGGYLMNPNELGMLAAMGASFSLIEVLGRKRLALHVTLLIISIVALAMTTSRSSFIGFFLVAFFIINGSENKRLKIGIYAAMLLSIPFVLQYVIFKAGDVEEVLSMTGRLPFWKALINEGIVKEPFWGFGFQRIYYKDHFESVHTYAGHMTHNTFLQVLMNLGFVGFTLMLFQMFFTFLGVGQSKDSHYKVHFMAAIIPLMINSFTEFGIFGQTNYAIFFYQFLIAYLFTGHSKYMTLQDRVNLNIKMTRARLNK